MPSIYGLKPRFQALLRPLARSLAATGITANTVTLAACVFSVGIGLALTFASPPRRWLLILPVFLFVRMTLNAIDGMLAREFNQKSHLGAYLNELTDVISDAALYMPFAYLPEFDPLWIAIVIVLAIISEMTGTVAIMTGASRRYDGPMGKSDRAFVFGAIALWLGLGGSLLASVGYAIPRLLALLLAVTIVNRVRQGLAEVAPGVH